MLHQTKDKNIQNFFRNCLKKYLFYKNQSPRYFHKYFSLTPAHVFPFTLAPSSEFSRAHFLSRCNPNNFPIGSTFPVPLSKNIFSE